MRTEAGASTAAADNIPADRRQATSAISVLASHRLRCTETLNMANWQRYVRYVKVNTA